MSPLPVSLKTDIQMQHVYLAEARVPGARLTRYVLVGNHLRQRGQSCRTLQSPGIREDTLWGCQEQAASGLGESLSHAGHLCHTGLSGTAPLSGCLTQFMQLPHAPRVTPVTVSQRESLVLTATTQQNAYTDQKCPCPDFLPCPWAVRLCGARARERVRG